MPFNGSGTFTRLFNWTADAGNNLPISATKFDGEDNDFAAGFGNCLTRDGQGAPTGPLTWSQPLTINVNADETVIAAGRTAGVNNPQIQLKVADGTGGTINLSSAQTLALAVQGANVITATPTTLALQIAGTSALTVNSNRQVAIAAPAAGQALSVTGLANQYAAFFLSGNVAGQDFGVQIQAGSTAADSAFNVVNRANSAQFINLAGDGSGTLGPKLAWGVGGNVTINAPASGQSLTINVSNNVTGFTITDGTSTLAQETDAAHTQYWGTSTAHALNIITNGSNRVSFGAAGNITIAAPSSGIGMTITGALNATALSVTGSIGLNGTPTISASSGSPGSPSYGFGTQQTGMWSSAANFVDFSTNGIDALQLSSSQEVGIATPSTIGNLSGGLTQVGYLDAPRNDQSAGNYTLALTDRGKCINLGNHTYTIPANASIAFPVGTCILLVAGGGGPATIQITTDTLLWSPSGSAGTRTLALNGIASLLKISATAWYIYGTGLS